MESHLLQMRGLKQGGSREVFQPSQSHLLQMRGLKLNYPKMADAGRCRIFYRCVD